MAVTMVGFKLIFLILSLTFALFLAGLNQVVSEQAVDGPSPLDTMIQRLQQEQDQRLGTNDISAAASNTRSSRGRSHDIKAMLTVYSDSFPTQSSFVLIFSFSLFTSIHSSTNMLEHHLTLEADVFAAID